MDGVAALARVLLECAEAFGIIGPAVAQARAKQLLQLGKAGEAQRLGEPHKGRGLHFGVARERGRGAQRKFVRMPERVSRGLPEALGQVWLDLDQPALKSIEAFWRFGWRRIAHRSPLWRDASTCLRYVPTGREK